MENFRKLFNPLGDEPNPFVERNKNEALSCVGDQAKVDGLLEKIDQLMASDPEGHNYAPYTLITTLVAAYEERDKQGNVNEEERVLFQRLMEKKDLVFRHNRIPEDK